MALKMSSRGDRTPVNSQISQIIQQTPLPILNAGDYMYLTSYKSRPKPFYFYNNFGKMEQYS